MKVVWIALFALISINARAEKLKIEQCLYQQDFEKTDPVKFWVTKGKYTVNFKGLTNEKAFSGEKSFKLDVTFNKASYFYWCIPVRIPAEGKLNFSGRILLGKQTTGRGRVKLGANVYCPPCRYGGGCLKLPSSSKNEKDGWRLIKGNIANFGKAVKQQVTSGIWGSTDENVGVYMNKVGIFLFGDKGDRVVVYIDDILIKGNVPTTKSYDEEIRKKWIPVKEKTTKKILLWEKTLRKIKGELTPSHGTVPLYVRVQGINTKILDLEEKIKKIKKKRFISPNEYETIYSTLKHLKNIVDNINSSQGCNTAKGEKMLLYVVSPISNQMILPDDTYIPGIISKKISMVATPGEYESASFVVSALSNIKSLVLKATDLKGEKGIIPFENVDVKTVKCWWQSGSAWRGIGQDRSKRILVPELLLNDDSLVKVDFQKKNNFLKLRFPAGEKYVCISDSKNIKKRKSLSVEKFPVKDSAVFMPIDISKNTNKQFWITVRVPNNTRDGVYKGKIELLTEEKSLATFTLKLRVLPFKLSSPKTCYDPKKDFTSSIYYRGTLNPSFPNGGISADYKNKKQLGAEMKDLVAHGVTNVTCYQKFSGKLLDKYLEVGKEAGLCFDPLYLLSVKAHSNFSNIKKVIELARSKGIKEVYFYGKDEARGERLKSQRTAWKALHEIGGKIFVAGFQGSCFNAMGDILDLFVCSSYPTKKEADKWHSKGNKIWCYNSPQGGVENPQIYRRNFGLLLWKSNYDGACTYAYQDAGGNIWNDFDSNRHRSLNFTYPTTNGIIGTIAWEGYREGIDDIKYATTLLEAIGKAKKSSSRKMKIIAKRAEKYLMELDVEGGDLDIIRSKIIEYILKMKSNKQK